MESKREAKRRNLKERLVEASAARIAEHGLTGFRARDVAGDIGCALGSIYTVFEDLDDLIVHVNARTLANLGAALQGAGKPLDPEESLRVLAQGYARFAQHNRNLWAALFDHRMADGGPSPDWLLKNHSILLEQLIEPLRALQPGMSEEDLRVRAQTYFSAVHGIVSISLQKRFLGLPEDRLLPELDIFVRQVAKGMK